MSSVDERVRKAKEAVDALDRRIERAGYPDSESVVSTSGPVIGKTKQMEALRSLLKLHPSVDGAWYVLANEKGVPAVAKNVLWQDMVAAWNRRGVVSNEESNLLLTIRFRN